MHEKWVEMAPLRTLRARRIPALLAQAATLFLVAVGPSHAATILIDFNDANTAGVGWNTFHAGNDGTTQSLVLDDGTASGFDITLPTFNDSGNAGWNGANPLPSWAPAEVVDDYSFFNAFFDGGSQTAQFVLGNLDASLTYSIDFIISRNLPRTQDLTITHGGGVATFDDWDSQADGWVAGNLITFTGLTADAADEIVIEMRRDGASAAFNAIRIVGVPEASSGLLLALGLAACVRGRDRRAD